MAYEHFKDLTRQMATDKTVTKHLILLKIQNMMDIEGVLLQCFIGFLIKDCKWGC